LDGEAMVLVSSVFANPAQGKKKGRDAIVVLTWS
jgi:hypothetical protein